MTLRELLAIDEGGDCTGCPVCEPRRSVSGRARAAADARGATSVVVRSDSAAFSVRYTDARTNPNEEGVMTAVLPEA